MSMTEKERNCFNDALGKNQAFVWRDRTIERLRRKLEPLNYHDKIQLLRKIDDILA